MRRNLAKMHFPTWKVYICHLLHVTIPVLNLKKTVDDLEGLDKTMVLV